jgi:hypothetical protein
MLRNPLEVAQGAKRPFLGFIVVVPENVQQIPTLLLLCWGPYNCCF